MRLVEAERSEAAAGRAVVAEAGEEEAAGAGVDDDE